MNKRLVKYRIVFVFGDNPNYYLNKETTWYCNYLTIEEIQQLVDNWETKYTTFNSLWEDVDRLPYTTCGKNIFGKEYIRIHFPYDMEPYTIYNSDSKYLPIRVYLEVKDYNPSIRELADNLDTFTFLEFIKDQGLTGGLINELSQEFKEN